MPFSIYFQHNYLTYEKLECVEFPNSGIKFTKCIARLIGRDRVRIHVEHLFNRTIETIFMHTSVFYQFSTNEYRPFLYNVWEDFCGYMKGYKTNIFLNMFYPIFRQNTNFNQTCPYKPGVYTVKFDNVSVNAFDFVDIVPAGRYRLQMSYHDSFKGPTLGIHKISFSVSDHRVQKFWFVESIFVK